MSFWDFMSGSTPAGVISETGQKVVTGIFDGVGAMIDRFHLSDTEKQEMKMELARMQLDAYKTQISDVQSARQMQMANKSMWPGLLSAITLIGFFGAGAFMLKYGLPPATDPSHDIVLIMVQTLVSGVLLVYGFWLGTSSNSAKKDEMLMNSVPASTIAPKP